MVLRDVVTMNEEATSSYEMSPEYEYKAVSTFQQSAVGDEVKPNEVPSETVGSNGQTE